MILWDWLGLKIHWLIRIIFSTIIQWPTNQRRIYCITWIVALDSKIVVEIIFEIAVKVQIQIGVQQAQ